MGDHYYAETHYRGLWCRGCGAELDDDGCCPSCEPALTEEDVNDLYPEWSGSAPTRILGADDG